jgi:hypothetical protein
MDELEGTAVSVVLLEIALDSYNTYYQISLSNSKIIIVSVIIEVHTFQSGKYFINGVK